MYNLPTIHTYLRLILGAILLAAGPASAQAAPAMEKKGPRWLSNAVTHGPSIAGPKSMSGNRATVDHAIINPYRRAVVGTEVAGIIGAFRYDEGDLVKKGQVVVEISKRRYQAAAGKARTRLKSLARALARATAEADLKEKLLNRGAATQQEFMHANADREAVESEMEEVKQALGLALMDVKACTVRAPFTGYINERFKQAYEPVERLQKLFEIVDTARVYAVANVPEASLAHFPRRGHAVFVHTSGKRFKGVIAKLGKSIDPKSKTKKISVLIDNRRGELEMGMSGSLPAKGR